MPDYNANPETSSQQQNPLYQAYSHSSSMPPNIPPIDRVDGSGDYVDVHMQDSDPYNRSKYARAQSHIQQSTLARPAHLPVDESPISQTYSPMSTTLSPPSQFSSFPQGGPDYSPASQHQLNRQSPSKSSYTTAAQSYYSQQPASSPRSGINSASSFVSPQTAMQQQQHQQGRGQGQQNSSGAISHGINIHPAQPSMQHPTSQGFSSPQQPSIDNSRFYGTSHVQSSPQNTSAQVHSQPQTPQRESVPKFSPIVDVLQLDARTNTQPAFRRAHPEGGFISPLQALTCSLPSTYRICNPNFKYESSRNPRRVLTKPSKGVKNDGYDNEDSDYILYVNDILGSEDTGKNRYLILDVLGQGTFGQVVKCQNLKTQEVVAVKVVKNRTAYFNQSMMEVSVLDLLNSKLDKNDDHHILRLKDTFIHKQHLCLVFELLSVNLYELIKQNQFRGLSTTLVRVFAQQLLNALTLLNKAKLIHCDLKPENILLKNLESPIIKVIDFGSACDERQTVYTYIQSRFYRSPEVLLCLPYSSAIDMWSLGCIVVELFLGLPLFPGSSEYNQVARIVEMLGLPPTWMLEMGKQSGEFFEKVTDEFGRKTYQLKSMEKYSREHGSKEQPSKKYFQATTLNDIITQYSMPRKNMKPAEIEREMNNRVAFIDFVRGLLNINPLERWSPQQAKLHPFITQQKYTGPFVPPMNLKSPPSTQKSPLPNLQQQAEQAKQKAMQASLQQPQGPQPTQGYPPGGSYIPSSHHGQTQQHPPVYSSNSYAAASHQQYPMQGSAQPPPYVGVNSQYSNQGGPVHQGSHMLPQQQQPAPSQQQQQQQIPLNNGPPILYPNQQQPSLYQTATTRAGRQRATTIGQNDNGIPPQISRHASLLDPNQPIRLQPSPAYYPPPPDMDGSGSGNRSRRRSQVGPSQGGQSGSAQRAQRDFIRTLEDRTLEDGLFNNHQQWQ